MNFSTVFESLSNILRNSGWADTAITPAADHLTYQQLDLKIHGVLLSRCQIIKL